MLEGNQRAKIETTERRRPHRPVPPDLRRGGRRVRARHRPRPGLPADRPQRRTGTRAPATTWRAASAPILKRGPDHLLWAIADDLIDGYFPFADRIGDAIDDVQDEVVRKATPDTVERLFKLKRELIQVRRAISPVREVFNQLTNRDETLIDPEEIVYFRDIYDHVIRLTDELDNYRELASATLDVYLTQVNNNLSVIMKRLTGVTVILAGIGAVAGIFGMSEAAHGDRRRGGDRVLGDHRARGRGGGAWRRSCCAGSTGSDGPTVRPSRSSGARERRQGTRGVARRVEQDGRPRPGPRRACRADR